MLAFLRTNTLLRSNDEGASLCEDSPGHSTTAPTAWARELTPGVGSDVVLICALVPHEIHTFEFALRTPANATVATASVTADPTHVIFTTDPVPPGIALVAAIPGNPQLQFVGFTEQTHREDDENWIVQITSLLAVDRPEGLWNVSMTSAEIQLNGKAQIFNHCNPVPPSTYPAGDPLIISTDTAFASSSVIDPAANCRVLPDFVGHDFAATRDALQAWAQYGEFTLESVTGNCGRLLGDGDARDNEAGFVEASHPASGGYYNPGETVGLAATIRCPEFPPDLLSVRYSSAGAGFWQAAPLPYSDVAARLEGIRPGYPDWRWEGDPECSPTATVSRFEANEVVPFSWGYRDLGVIPGMRVPLVVVEC